MTADRDQVEDEICAAILAGFEALDRISPDAASRWASYLEYGYERAVRENAAA